LRRDLRRHVIRAPAKEAREPLGQPPLALLHHDGFDERCCGWLCLPPSPSFAVPGFFGGLACFPARFPLAAARPSATAAARAG
jgi:hypothetical protein